MVVPLAAVALLDGVVVVPLDVVALPLDDAAGVVPLSAAAPVDALVAVPVVAPPEEVVVASLAAVATVAGVAATVADCVAAAPG
jgi:hypothetical protein